MRSRSLLQRVLFLALAIVQMGAPALASVADASLAARTTDVAFRTHVEDHTHPRCAATHADDCVLCQLLSHGAATPGEAPAPRVPRRALLLGSTQDCVAFAGPRARAAEQPRAPPTLA